MKKDNKINRWREKHGKTKAVTVFLTPEQREQIESLYKASGENSRQEFYANKLTTN